jgi:hypothetical protein
MARLTKRAKARLEAEGREFTRVDLLLRPHGYRLSRMMGLHPYSVLTVDHPMRPVFEGTLADIDTWVQSRGETNR